MDCTQGKGVKGGEGAGEGKFTWISPSSSSSYASTSSFAFSSTDRVDCCSMVIKGVS